MPDYILSESTRKGKRFQITNPDGKTIHFGSDKAQTFLEHKSNQKKKAWIARHKAGNPEAWNDKSSPLFFARVLLWNKPTLSESIKDVRKRYGFHIKLSR